MLAELIRELVGLGRRTTEVAFESDDRCPKRLWLRHGDTMEEIDVPPPDRQHQLAGLDDLTAALLDPQIAPAPEVYVSASGVVALLDREDRRARVTVRFAESRRWATIVALQQPQKYQPKAAVKMLKMDLHGGNVGHVIQSLSRVNFQRTSAGSTSVEHGRESLGRSVEAAVQQAKDVPEEFDLAVPVWSTSGFSRFTVHVRFGLYLDLEEQCVELRVLADEVERARNQALAAVVKELGDRLKVPVFLGAP